MAALIDPGARTLTENLTLVPGAYVYFFDPTDAPTPAYAELEIRRDPDDPFEGELIFEFRRPHLNPIRSDAAGRLPPIFLDINVTYRMLMTDADGNELHNIENFTVFPGPEQVTPYDDSGAPMPGCVLTLYRSRTHIIDSEYVADENGVFEAIELNDEYVYRAVLHNANGELIYDVDPYLGSGQGLGGMGGCMCPEHAFLFTDNGADRRGWTNIESITFLNFDSGTYQVNFTPGTFTNPPVVTANAIPMPEGPNRYGVVVEVGTDYAIVRFVDDEGTPAGGGFHLHAWGPENYETPSSG